MPLLWAGRKGPASYTRYFALGMHLSPALQSLFSFHLGCGYDARKKKKMSKNIGTCLEQRTKNKGTYLEMSKNIGTYLEMSKNIGTYLEMSENKGTYLRTKVPT